MWTFQNRLAYLHVKPALESELVARTLIAGAALQLAPAKVLNGAVGEVEPAVRRSRIAFFPENDAHRWLYEVMQNIGQDMNARYFGFDLRALAHIQFAEYADDDGYDWHIDLDRGAMVRKLSICVQLSPPNDYDGGEVEARASRVPIVASKKPGDALMFPSFVEHRVAPVTRGLRRSIVAWYLGPAFR